MAGQAEPRQRARPRHLAALLVVAALIAPAVIDNDSFPLATYPMYAQPRGAVVAVPTAIGVTGAGDSVRLSLEIIGDSDDPLIVTALLRDATAAGSPQVDALCRGIARRAADEQLVLDRVEVVTETHDVVERAAERSSLVDRRVHATCEVER